MFKKAIDLLFYSNFYIAFCAVAMTLQTQLFLQQPLHYSPLIGFIFSATLMTYAAHRIIGLFRLKEFLAESRYLIINRFKSHIWVYAAIGLVGSVYSFTQLSTDVQLALSIPSFLSLGYILPIFGRKKRLRLRDFNGIKIFLVAGVWAYVSVILPSLESSVSTLRMAGMFVERFLFVFAITLPFDIRDIKVDQYNQVKTIPALIGIPRTVQLAILLLILSLFIGFWLQPLHLCSGILVAILMTAYFVYRSPRQQNDYFFTGLMDGTMIIQFLCVYLFSLVNF